MWVYQQPEAVKEGNVCLQLTDTNGQSHDNVKLIGNTLNCLNKLLLLFRAWATQP